MFSKTTLALAVAIVLGTFPALAGPNTIIAAPTLPLLVAAVRHLADQLGVALARDLALVHHQIGTSACPSWSRNEAGVECPTPFQVKVSYCRSIGEWF